LTELGRQLPFSQREIWLADLKPKILATSFWLKPLAFRYFLKQLGILFNLMEGERLESSTFFFKLAKAENLKRKEILLLLAILSPYYDRLPFHFNR
jgi:hypothetical protein